MTRKVLFDYDKDGFRAEEYCHVGQWGTHIDPPTHFHKGLRSQDQIDVKEMLMPLVVLDVHAKVAANPDYVLSLADVRAWEARHGAIPKGAFVAMRMQQSRPAPSPAPWSFADRMYGLAHCPAES